MDHLFTMALRAGMACCFDGFYFQLRFLGVAGRGEAMNPGLFKQKDASVNPRISESQNSRLIVMECENSKKSVILVIGS